MSVIGGGLVGAVQSLYLRKQGYEVHLYESHGDMRLDSTAMSRSINLTMSSRARAALKKIDLDEFIFKHSLPMYARRIHNTDGSTFDVKYSNKGDANWSIHRAKLNMLLLSKAEEAGVHMHFKHRLVNVDFKLSELTFKVDDETSEVKQSTDFIFGCDGAFSHVRNSMSRAINFSQEFISHGYKELEIPPTKENDFALSPKHLHIWPRNEFMLVAMPNNDKTFTGTLFMPEDIFSQLNTRAEVERFFAKHYPDAMEMMGKENLVRNYFENPVGSLISVKCKPYHYKNAVLLGDAAHAMVPFYGQGMNAGFEDCMVFDGLLAKYNKDLYKASAEYSLIRPKEGECMSNLSMYNYVELRSHMNDPKFLLKRKIEFFMDRHFPNLLLPLYPSISFSPMPYTEIMERVQRQDKVFAVIFTAMNAVKKLGGYSLCLAIMLGTIYILLCDYVSL